MYRPKKLLAALLAAAMICMAGCAADTAEGSSAADTTVSAVTEDIAEDTSAEDSNPADGETGGFSTTADGSEDDEDAEPSEPSEPAESTLSVTCTNTNSWQEGGMFCTQLDIAVKNSSAEAVDGWEISLDFGQDTEVMQSWNASIEGSGAVIRAANVDYNAEIQGGAEVTFGIIVKTASVIGDVAVTAEGEAVGTTAGFGGGEQTSAQPEQITSQPEQTTAPSQPDIGEIEHTNRAGLVSEHGRLSVRGADLVDQHGEPMQLRGVSTHGIQWFPQFANKDAFRHLRDEWHINVIRLAMYSGAGEGYTDSTKAGIEQTVQDAVDACIELDMYVIVDWHVLQDQSPQVRKADALRFFEYMSAKYADYPNVIYEICNEPNGYASWGGDVKPYAEEVIPVIRKNAPDSIVIVGTPTWSQDIDKALADPLKYDNVMYALHYYAATHTDWLRDRLRNCYNSGLPIIVSEFGNCDASGNGNNDLAQAEKWLQLLDSLNISYMNWSLCDKNEAASILRSGASVSGGWGDNDLTENGRFMRDWFRDHDR